MLALITQISRWEEAAAYRAISQMETSASEFRIHIPYTAEAGEAERRCAERCQGCITLPPHMIYYLSLHQGSKHSL